MPSRQTYQVFLRMKTQDSHDIWRIEMKATSRFDALVRVVNAIGENDDAPKIESVISCGKLEVENE